MDSIPLCIQYCGISNTLSYFGGDGPQFLLRNAPASHRPRWIGRFKSAPEFVIRDRNSHWTRIRRHSARNESATTRWRGWWARRPTIHNGGKILWLVSSALKNFQCAAVRLRVMRHEIGAEDDDGIGRWNNVRHAGQRIVGFVVIPPSVDGKVGIWLDAGGQNIFTEYTYFTCNVR